ncbi:MAG: 2Fe-2S iron-sulfur cluster-binding protein [Firmicutes bacterium]|nr:2Fe-2S iron-sulfur cluster-binding protein [Bacillota bacterium]
MNLNIFQITVRETGETFPCKPDETVLAAMLRSGRGPFVCGCFGGGCGICRMKICAGEYEKVKRMSRAHVSEDDEKNGVALLCCVRPRGDMVITKLS